MPTYTYYCDNCGIQFDQYQHFSDPPLTRCPECNKKTLRKVYAPVGIVFKGSGFYSTDHRSPSGGRRSGSGEKGEEPKKESGSEADSTLPTKDNAPTKDNKE